MRCAGGMNRRSGSLWTEARLSCDPDHPGPGLRRPDDARRADLVLGRHRLGGGVAIRLVRMAEVLVGWLPGSLAQIVVVASMFFGGVTGSAVAEVSSIGSMMIPGMVKDGYSRRFATAIVLTAATMGPIIPPSIGLIFFPHIAGSVSIAALFLPGAIPGVLIRYIMMVASFVHGKL